MRLRSAIWVAAYVRRCSVEGIPVAVMRRGAEEAGAIFIIVNRLDGTVEVYGPAPQTAFDEAAPAERLWMRALGEGPVPEADATAFIARQHRFDPDIWVVEIEERSGRHLLEPVVS